MCIRKPWNASIIHLQLPAIYDDDNVPTHQMAISSQANDVGQVEYSSREKAMSII